MNTHVYLVDHGHTQSPIGTFISGSVKQPIYHPLNDDHKPTWLLHLMIFHMTYNANLLEV
jgi:hypothetical protein